MNNGRPNYGNAPAWGNTPQNQQNNYGGAPQMGQSPVQPRPGYQPGYQQGYPGYQPQGGSQPQGGNHPQGAQPYPPYGQPVRPAQPQPYPQQPYGYGQQRTPYPPQPYQGQQSYPQGQPPYQQRFQQPYQQPPQGYGYQQPPQQRKPGVRPDALLMVMLCGVLPVLFILGMVLSAVPALKWVFVALALTTVLALWVKPVLAHNVKLTFSGVYSALAIVALVSALTAAPVDHTASQGSNQTGNTGTNGQTVTQQQQQNQLDQQNAGGDLGSLIAVPTEPPAAVNMADSVAKQQLESFFYFWSVNNQENMLSLCAPSWQRSVEEPRKALFSILQNRIPVDYTLEKLGGTENDSARMATVVATIDRQNGHEPQKYRFQVFLLKEDSDWYIDPSSLQSNESITTAPPTSNTTPTPPPAPAEASSNTVLYYNPDGGVYYHINPECPSASKKNLPFKGSFRYSEINDSAYKKLKPCLTCGAPVRP